MKKILNIISSVNGSDSYSNKLAEKIISSLKTLYPDSEVKNYDLNKMKFPHVTNAILLAAYVNPASFSEEQMATLKISDTAIQDLWDSEVIVIGVPMYNFGIPSPLKAWIDHIIRAGVTFRFKEDGQYEGLVPNKKVYLAIASGGIYSIPSKRDFDFTENYLRAVLGVIGIQNITTFRVEGTAIPEFAANSMSSALESIGVSTSL